MRIKDTFINPFTDFGFKKLFGNEFNKDILMDFLNELLRNDEGTITDLNFGPNEYQGRNADDRKAIFDIYCENEKGEKFIVEIQKVKQKFFKDRLVYYSTFPIQQQAERGDWKFELKAVYTIGILDFVFDEDKESADVCHHEVKLFDQKTNKVFFDKLTYIYLEMPKFTKTESELETHFDKWLYVLKNLALLTNRPARLQEKIFTKLFNEAQIANFDDTQYSHYEQSLKHYRDLKNSLDFRYDEGMAEGVAQGIAQGIAQGVAQIIATLHANGMAIATIADMTGVNAGEVKRILGITSDDYPPSDHIQLSRVKST